MPGPLPRERAPGGERGARGFDGIQALRALAACAVALLHVADEAGALAGTPGRSPWRGVDALPLEAGVDLFFVISGFVMAWASWDAFGSVRSVAPFVARRLLRIVPLYWLLSLAAGGGRGGGAGPDQRRRCGTGRATWPPRSLFWPWRRLDGFVQPVLRLGWTLEYEMLFYALVAAALPLRRPAALIAILLALGGLVLAGQAAGFTATPLVFWTDPVVAEFALGRARRHGRAARAGAPDGPAWPPASCSRRSQARRRTACRARCCAACRRRCWCSRRCPGAAFRRLVLLVGNASYALYLVHPFPMRALRVLAARFAVAPAPTVAVTMAVCLAAALALHRLVEQPVLRWGRQRTRSPAG